MLLGTAPSGETERAAELAPSGTSKELASDSERIFALEEALGQQATQLAEMRKLLLEQQDTIELLEGKLPGVGMESAREDLAMACSAHLGTLRRAFGNTPPGSLNRATTRLQFDTVIRF